MDTKAHLVFPKDVLDEVDRYAGKRRRSAFILQATKEKLERERFRNVLKQTQGAWTEEAHPDLKTAGDVERYVREKRESYRTRKGKA